MSELILSVKLGEGNTGFLLNHELTKTFFKNVRALVVHTHLDRYDTTQVPIKTDGFGKYVHSTLSSNFNVGYKIGCDEVIVSSQTRPAVELERSSAATHAATKFGLKEGDLIRISLLDNDDIFWYYNKVAHFTKI